MEFISSEDILSKYPSDISGHYSKENVIAAMNIFALSQAKYENKSILTMAEKHMDEHAVIVIKERLFELERAIDTLTP